MNDLLLSRAASGVPLNNHVLISDSLVPTHARVPGGRRRGRRAAGLECPCRGMLGLLCKVPRSTLGLLRPVPRRHSLRVSELPCLRLRPAAAVFFWGGSGGISFLVGLGWAAGVYSGVILGFFFILAGRGFLFWFFSCLGLWVFS